ncbi:MAG: AAA family ATPase [Bacteroidales bacterium]|nr:AAA family ATPase [Bacteroidales bacterium]
MDLDCSKGANVFIGDNGAGKSTVLEAIGILFSWLNARYTSTKGRGWSILGLCPSPLLAERRFQAHSGM